MDKIKVFCKSKLFFLENVKDFQRLNSKDFGYKKNDFYFLDFYEVLYLLERDKILVYNLNEFKKNKNKSKEIENSNLDFNCVLKKFSRKKVFLNYLVYKDLKKRGYVVKTGLKYGTEFRVYDKGIKIGEDHSLWLVCVFEQKEKFEILDLVKVNRIAHSTKKKILFAIVDEEKSITYIQNNWQRM